MKPKIPVDLVCVDTTPKAYLAERAVLECTKQADFSSVKLLTNKSNLKHAVQIPEIRGLEGYSRFCIGEMARHVQASHALVVQWDGYVLNTKSWTDEFLKYDYIGAPFQPSDTVGNGGFSLRSKKLLDYISRANWKDPHPEDSAICIRHRAELEALGFKFAPAELARKFSFEGRSWDGMEWSGVQNKWDGSFGFHSFLSVIPKKHAVQVFHHSGDSGDVIYGLATMKALGGGVMFFSCDNKYPYPMNSRWCRLHGSAEWVDNIAPLLEAQDYVWAAKYTHGTPFTTTHDLNKFRETWGTKTPSFDSLFQIHATAFDLLLQEDEPWLTVPDPISFPNFPIVVARTPRYRNDKFPWGDLCAKYGDRMIFVGGEDEHLNFSGFLAPRKVPHFRTKNMLHLAQVIAGAKVFIGNQSAPLAIAHGLCKNCLVETWPLNANCCLKRDNAIYFNGDSVDIPKGWL